MRDRDQEYPKHQPGRGEHEHHDPFAIQEEGELEEPQGRERPVHQRETATTPELPYARGRKALIVGVIAGAIYEVARIVITLVNSATFREGAKYTLDKMPSGLAFTLTELGVLGYAIGVVGFFLGGLIIGRVSVHRRWAFIGGFVGGILCSLVSSILQQIPGYPSNTHTGFNGGLVGVSSGFLVLILWSLFLCLITGLISLLGGWLTTRHHPYYVGYYG